MKFARLAESTVPPGPIRVVRVDVDRTLQEISPFREGGEPYTGAWVIALRHGRPLGHIEVNFDGKPVSPAVLDSLLRKHLGDSWSKLADAEVVGDAQLPLVSVVVPSTFERTALLERCVASLLAQDYPAFEVVVVDNRPNASPERAEFRRSLCSQGPVTVVAEPRPGTSAARNRGAVAAVGAIIAFTDDDVEVEPGWLRAIGSRFVTDPQTDCVTGMMLPNELEAPSQIWFQRSGSNFGQHYDTVHFANSDAWRGRFLGGLRRSRFEITARRAGAPDETFLIYRAGWFGAGASLSVRASALREVGGFDENLGGATPTLSGEDHLFLVQLLFTGHTVTIDPAASVFHVHRRDLVDLKFQMYGYGVGYTAMLTALVWRDAAHLSGMLRYALQAVVLLPRKLFSSPAAAPDYPRELSRTEFRGLVIGPLRYFRSLRNTRGRIAFVQMASTAGAAGKAEAMPLSAAVPGQVGDL